jgi:hypothetical protein
MKFLFFSQAKEHTRPRVSFFSRAHYNAPRTEYTRDAYATPRTEYTRDAYATRRTECTRDVLRADALPASCGRRP